MNIVLFGAPGAGKGTQSTYLVKRYGLCQVSSGNLLRDEIANGTEVGKKIEKTLATGEFPDQSIVDTIVAKYVQNHTLEEGFVFDGYPRFIEQAQKLDVLLESLNQKIDLIIELNVEPNEIIKRLSGRFVCAQCGHNYHETFSPPVQKGICDQCQSTEFKKRPDDREEVIRKRLDKYEQETKKVLSYYEENHIYIASIEGGQDVKKVSKRISEVIDKIVQKDKRIKR